MKMNLTDYLAIWGAVVATAVAIWNIYKDVIRRNYVEVRAGFRIMTPPQEEVFVFRITNHSDHEIKVTHCGGYADRKYKPKWIGSLVYLFKPHTGRAFMMSVIPSKSAPLPVTIKPHDSTMIIYGVNRDDFPTEFETLEVATSDNHNWYCPRKDIEAIHGNDTFKEILARKAAKGPAP
jgi:hypothetical protein